MLMTRICQRTLTTTQPRVKMVWVSSSRANWVTRPCRRHGEGETETAVTPPTLGEIRELKMKGQSISAGFRTPLGMEALRHDFKNTFHIHSQNL